MKFIPLSNVRLKGVLSILLINVALYSQEGFIKGTVLSEILEPLAGANISIEETTMGAMTDMQGEFLIKELSPGSYTLNIGYIGYKNISQTYSITYRRKKKKKNIKNL